MLVGLTEILTEANREHRAVPCFNVFNLDFVSAIITAAEEEKAPVILALNQDMVNEYGLPKLASFLLSFSELSSARICPHLDHTYDAKWVKQALELGLKSVMFDASQEPLPQNIAKMQEMAKLCKVTDADLEGEVGSVAYADNAENKKHIKNEKTKLEDAKKMAEESGVNALAVSIGNIHRLSNAKVKVEYDLLQSISDAVNIPLVIHGTSGIDEKDIKKIALETKVAKFNIATDMREVWGHGLRGILNADSTLFDPMTCSSLVKQKLTDRAKYWINLLR